MASTGSGFENMKRMMREGIRSDHVAEAYGFSPQEVEGWDPERFNVAREQLIARVCTRLPALHAVEQEARLRYCIPDEMTIEDAVTQGEAPETVTYEMEDVADPVARKIYNEIMTAELREIFFGTGQSTPEST